MNNSTLASKLRSQNTSVQSLADIAAPPATATTTTATTAVLPSSQSISVPPMPGTQYGLPAQLQQNPIISSESSGRVAIFWDYENVPPPQAMPGYVVVENIRNVVHHFGHITLFKAYLEINDTQSSNSQQQQQPQPQSIKKILRSELQSSGVTLTDCPHNGRKDAADKMLMVDMLAFAIDNPAPATIVLISGDKDYAYSLGVLRNRRYNIVLVCPGRGAPIILRSQANYVLEWRYDVLNQDVWQMQMQQVCATASAASSYATAVNSLDDAGKQQRKANGNVTTNGNNTGPVHSNTAETLINSSSTEISPVSHSNSTSSSANSPTGTSAANAGIEKSLKISTTQQLLAVGEHKTDDNDYVGFVFSPRAPGFFDLLVEILEKFRAVGEDKPRRSKVGNELTNRNPLLYHRAGCSNFKEYVDLAVKEGIVDIGGDKGLAWMTLNASYRDKLR